jgi:lysyl-tRNA synthetase class 2
MPSSRLAFLHDRAEMLAQARAFFKERHVLEVDCPIITAGASVDAHIDLIPASYLSQETRYLHSSPEYGMKRLLSEGIGDIYQISHVFRDGEFSKKHNPEFTMVEWYRVGISFADMIAETIEFIRLFLGKIPSRSISYREAFQLFAGFDYLTISIPELLHTLEKLGITPYPEVIEEGKEALLNLVLGIVIEPHLGKDELCALTHYPASQAALAQTGWHGDEQVSERFEIYYQGLELCNGYHELTDALEQRQRFQEANTMRIQMGKKSLPPDELFLKALEKGLPNCCGVAVGFDRLMMLRLGKSNIADVIPFDWSRS